jgi:hypothetical protein
MTTKSAFKPEAWKAIVEAPAKVAQLVMVASFGPGDVRKEMMAMIHKVEALEKQPGDLPLLKELAAELKHNQEAAKNAPHTPPPQSSEQQDAAVEKARLLGNLKSVHASLDAHATPQEAAAVKQWLYSIGEDVAKASKEGDFMGFGGKQVNDAETAVLAEIKAALGL